VREQILPVAGRGLWSPSLFVWVYLFDIRHSLTDAGSRIDVATIREFEKVRSPFRTARWKSV
jgi:hypothetical protein